MASNSERQFNVPLLPTMKASAAALLLGVALVQSAHAQSLPGWTVEFSGGQGNHPTRAGNAWYFDVPEAVLRVGASYQLAGNAGTAASAKLDYLTDWHMGEKASCTVTPTGGCYGTFHPGHGGSVAVGVRQTIVAPLVVGAAAGVGQYGGSDGGSGLRPYVEAELVVRIVRHLALTASGRYMNWSAAGVRYWYAPILFGLQLR